MRATLLVLVSILAGCGFVERPLDVQVDVWNRTLDAIYLLDQRGVRLDVPACDHAHIDSFRVNEFAVYTDSGEWFGAGEGNVTGLPWHRLIVTASAHDPLVTVVEPQPFPGVPACTGHPSEFPTAN